MGCPAGVRQTGLGVGVLAVVVLDLFVLVLQIIVVGQLVRLTSAQIHWAVPVPAPGVGVVVVVRARVRVDGDVGTAYHVACGVCWSGLEQRLSLIALPRAGRDS